MLYGHPSHKKRLWAAYSKKESIKTIHMSNTITFLKSTQKRFDQQWFSPIPRDHQPDNKARSEELPENMEGFLLLLLLLFLELG